MIYMDFDWDILLGESVAIMSRASGFSYNDIISFPYDRYEKLIEILKEQDNG